MGWTTDGFLNGALQIEQPATGFRAGSDAVLLAAAVAAATATGKLNVLDVGCGVGTAGLCVKHRIRDTVLIGLDVQGELVEAAKRNARHNNLEAGCQFHQVNIAKRRSFEGILMPDGQPLLAFGFDHVITNPPFYEAGRAQSSPSEIKTLAHLEGDADLFSWIKFSIARTRPKGRISIIHRADRLGDILNALDTGKCGDIKVLPLWPNELTPAKRVLVQGTKGNGGPLKLLRGLVLHEQDGKPTEIADRILRDGLSLEDQFK